MRVGVDYSLAAGTLKALVGGCVLLAAMPTAVVLGLSAHPDAFPILVGTILIAASFGFSLWLLMAVGEVLKALLVLTIVGVGSVLAHAVHAGRAYCARRLTRQASQD